MEEKYLQKQQEYTFTVPRAEGQKVYHFGARRFKLLAQRDRESEAALNGLGFTVLRFWSRDVLRSPDVCVDTVKKAVLKNKLNVD